MNDDAARMLARRAGDRWLVWVEGERYLVLSVEKERVAVRKTHANEPGSIAILWPQTTTYLEHEALLEALSVDVDVPPWCVLRTAWERASVELARVDQPLEGASIYAADGVAAQFAKGTKLERYLSADGVLAVPGWSGERFSWATVIEVWGDREWLYGCCEVLGECYARRMGRAITARGGSA